jgi:hypothetical protein
MSNARLIFILLLMLVFEGKLLATVSANRFLSTDKASSGMLLEVTIELTFSGSKPAALILSEILPDGLQLENATWNGKGFAPSLTQGQTLKWFFGLGGEAVLAGVLVYHLRVLSEISEKVFFSGSVQIPNLEATVLGERILWLNHDDFAAPEFTPASGAVFEQELQVSLSGKLTAGAAIFLCFDEPEAWNDWQFYEGPFTIQHSQRLQAQIWLADDSASLTSKAEYYRQAVCELELRQGWNLLGIPLEMPVQEITKLNAWQLFNASNRQIETAGCGQAFWLFAEKDCSLHLSGREPFQRGVTPDCAVGWNLVCPLGLEEIIPSAAETFWGWENQGYQLIAELKPGKGYWRYQAP